MILWICKNMTIRYLLTFSCFLGHLLLNCQCQNSRQEKAPTIDAQKAIDTPKSSPYATALISYKLIKAEDNTWGYDILVDGNLVVHQPSKPALPGNSGFATQEKARKVAGLVIEKIKKGQMPPTLSPEEMQNIGAL